MAFLISKLVEYLLLPSILIGFVAVLGILSLLMRRPLLGHVLLVVLVVSLLLAGWSPLGPLALMTLEDRFPAPRIEGSVSGIVMVGGAVNVHITKDRGSPALNDAGERITKVAALARKYPDAAFSCQAEPVTLGIIGDTASVTESAVAKDILVAIGRDRGNGRPA